MIFLNTRRKIFLLISIGVIGVGIAFFGIEIYFPKINKVPSSQRFLYIPRGTDYDSLLHILRNKKIISNEFSFKLNAKIFSLRNHVHDGRYELKSGMRIMNLIRQIKNGQQTPVKLTIRKFRTKNEFAHFISSKLEIDSTEFINLLNDSLYQKNNFGWNIENALSLFVPNTHEVYWNITLDDLMERMKTEYTKFWNAERLAKADSLGFSPAEITTIASIVEEETNEDSDKVLIAGVYINRLRKNMKLDADPTLKFAMNRFELTRLYTKHTKFESPYNTYMHKGLPPGLICIPSVSTIDAVLKYADKNLQNDYLYFCASATKRGYSVFAKTFDEQKKNAKIYQHYLDSINIH